MPSPIKEPPSTLGPTWLIDGEGNVPDRNIKSSKSLPDKAITWLSSKTFLNPEGRVRNAAMFPVRLVAGLVASVGAGVLGIFHHGIRAFFNGNTERDCRKNNSGIEHGFKLKECAFLTVLGGFAFALKPRAFAATAFPRLNK